MKLRIKYTNTQKFTVEIEQLTYGTLIQAVTNYIFSTYGIQLERISLSFNGKEPIAGDETSSLSSLGIVGGDLLVVFHPSETRNNMAEAPISCSASVSKDKQETNKNSAENPMENKCSSNTKVSNLLEAKDGMPPPSVNEYFERYLPSSDKEAMNLLVHITMEEAGFILGDSSSDASTRLPSSWKEMVATLKYHHPGFHDFSCTVVIVTMGNVQQILASFSGQEAEISVKVVSKEYIQSSQILPHRLTKLSQLAKLLRNNLLYPLQVAAHTTLGLPAPWHLAGLSLEILILIASMLDVKSVLNFSATCRRLNAASTDKKLWYMLFKRDFREVRRLSDTICGADWKEMYKYAYKRKKESQRFFANQPRLPLQEPDPPNPFPPTFPNPKPDFDPFGPYLPDPIGPGPYYPPQPYPQPNPFWDPDSPYFGGEIPRPPNPFPNPSNPLGTGRPRRPNPLAPPFMPPQPRHPRGPRFDYF